jgi:hypothetical protein
VLQVSCWVLALLFLCRASVLIERASHGGDGLSFERLLRSRMRRRVVCNGGAGLIFATFLHLVLPYYGEREALLPQATGQSNAHRLACLLSVALSGGDVTELA